MAKKRLPFFTGRGYGRGKSVEIWISARTRRILFTDREEVEQQIRYSMKQSLNCDISIFVPESALATRRLGTKTIPMLVLKPRLGKDEEDKELEEKEESEDRSEFSEEVDNIRKTVDREE